MNKQVGILLIFSLLVCLLAACAGSPAGGIEVRDAWVRASPGGMGEATASGHGTMMTPGAEMPSGGDTMAGMNSAAYMVIQNQGGEADRLLRIESDAAQAVELHQSEIVNDVMIMRPVDGIYVPAGGEARLEPGGFHAMLVGLSRPLEAGGSVALTLVFEKAGEIEVQADIRAP